jgi:Phosphatidylinositol-4-phosphate 5-Kinase
MEVLLHTFTPSAVPCITSKTQTHIVQITDVLFNFAPRLGRLFKTSPSNYLVIVNSARGEVWEEYDLKPTLYFYPERDFLGGWWTSKKTKDMLHDEFPGEIKLKPDAYSRVVSQLEKDSRFLCSMEAIDYSLFMLSRKSREHETPGTIRDALGEWEYRFAILDFFTGSKMVKTKLMKAGIGMFGHRDMTTTAPVRPRMTS